MNESVDRAIAAAFNEHLIDRTTLLVNMPFAEEAMELAACNGFAGTVGLHINLTTGRPLTKEMASDPVMCNAAGEFTADFARNIKTRWPRPTSSAVTSTSR